MIPMPGQLSERRKYLSEKIARERIDLAVAYRGLIKPFQIVDKGIVGINLLRKNTWLLALAPSAVGLLFSFFGLEKKKKPGLLGRLRGKAARSTDLDEERAEIVAKAKKPISRWGRRAWAAFQMYRKVRPFFP